MSLATDLALQDRSLVIKNVAPSWFASVMGTGILAITSLLYSQYLPFLKGVAVALFSGWDGTGGRRMIPSQPAEATRMTQWTSWTSLVVLGMAAVFAGPGLADAADPDLRQAIAAYLAEGPMESLRVQPGALEDDPREDFYFVLDVRTPSDFAAGHIQGAVNVPYTELLAHLDRLPADPGQAILTYCEHATRSTQALMALRLLGYRNVWYLTGGLDRWRQEGRPLGTAGP